MAYHKSCKVVLYPTHQQEELFWKHVNAARYIWNWGLATKITKYQEEQINLGSYALCTLLTQHKKEKPWLSEVSISTLQRVLNENLDMAWKNFYAKRTNFPKFKSKKKAKCTFPTGLEKTYIFDTNKVQIPKCGRVKCGEIPKWITPNKSTKLINPRITYTCNNKWILSFSVECESQAYELKENISIGIDLGIKELATIAILNNISGEVTPIVYKNINKTNYMRKEIKKLKRLQRAQSRAYRVNESYMETKNIKKINNKIQKQYAHIANIRENYRHHVTSEIIKMLPQEIIMEDLSVNTMMKNHHLATYISEAGFNDFINKMRYKCERYGIEFTQVDRFYPSSKTCSNCGCINSELKLKDRVYICPDCGFIIDRDFNAAINLAKYIK